MSSDRTPAAAGSGRVTVSGLVRPVKTSGAERHWGAQEGRRADGGVLLLNEIHVVNDTSRHRVDHPQPFLHG